MFKMAASKLRGKNAKGQITRNGFSVAFNGARDLWVYFRPLEIVPLQLLVIKGEIAANPK